MNKYIRAKPWAEFSKGEARRLILHKDALSKGQLVLIDEESGCMVEGIINIALNQQLDNVTTLEITLLAEI